MLDVDMGEALGMLSIRPQPFNGLVTSSWLIMDFVTNSKTIVENIDGNMQGISDYSAIINDYRSYSF